MSGTAALCHMPWCVPFCPQPLFIPSSTLSSFSQYILALSLDSSLCCSCLFWCISPHCHSVMLALRDFSHIGTNCHVFHTSRVYFAANILFSFPFSCLCCEDIIMFSLYLSVKVDYRPKHRPVICTELTYSRSLDQSEGQDREGDEPDQASSKSQLNAVSNTLVSLTLNMTAGHVSHDRCLELLPYWEDPPARRGDRVSQPSHSQKRGKAIFPLHFSTTTKCTSNPFRFSLSFWHPYSALHQSLLPSAPALHDQNLII
ncbi:hypothetical protein V8E52_007223 [Russula decolorans]|jgi:hypothetical protein